MAAKNFMEIRVPLQKHYSRIHFPVILTPSPSFPSSPALLTEAIKSKKSFLDYVLLNCGAVLFRRFPMSTALDFNDFVEAFGFEELSYIGDAALWTNVVGRVFTANESPPDQKILFHHEMAQVLEFPSKLFVFCEVEPASEGETPLVLSHIVYEKNERKTPRICREIGGAWTYLRKGFGRGEDDDLHLQLDVAGNPHS